MPTANEILFFVGSFTIALLALLVSGGVAVAGVYMSIKTLRWTAEDGKPVPPTEETKAELTRSKLIATTKTTTGVLTAMVGLVAMCFTVYFYWQTLLMGLVAVVIIVVVIVLAPLMLIAAILRPPDFPTGR